MRVGVGSGNPVKRDATELALRSGSDGFGTDATVEARPVPSGVSEQPRGHAETRLGAENRAAGVLEVDDYDLGVGIEGGVARFGPDDPLFLVMWAAVDDGGRVGRAAGPSLPLPPAIEDRIRDGEELGPVMDGILGTSGVAENQGAAGVFTAGRVDRTDALADAVAGALAPFVSDLY